MTGADVTSNATRQGCRAEIRAHIERELGPVKQVFHESTDNAVDVLHVAATLERPIHTLITAGMSDAPMIMSRDANAPRHLELMMSLPRHWKLDGVATTDTAYWPIRTLKSLACLPRQRGSALGWGDIVPNGNPPAPYAAGTQLCGVILAPSLLVPKEFYSLDAAGRHIEFYAAIPLYVEELELQRQQGMKHLLTTLIDHNINDLVDVKRRNVTRKRFGLF